MRTSPLLDVDAIMHDVRTAAKPNAFATTATLLQGPPNRSNVAIVAAHDTPEIEERAGLCADRVPPCYVEHWAMLNHQKPAWVSEASWRLALDDGGRFLDQWGSRAAELDWRSAELFAVRAGLVWRLCGDPVEDIYADRVLLASGLVILRQETRGFRV
jgi:hypothetical protein